MSNPMASGVRLVQSLDGAWEFRHESDAAPRIATVPAPWQANFADLRQTSGRATYKQRFSCPEEVEGKETVLRFGAVSYMAEVRVNGVEIGSHEGGYLPFDCIIPPHLLNAVNEVEVSCLLPDGSDNPEGIGFAEIPHGKQSWYGPIGGIWQSVTLETRDPAHLEHCAITADLATGGVTIRLTLPPAAIGATAELTITDAGGKTVASGKIAVKDTEASGHLTVPAVLAWSPDAPHLYTLDVAITRDGTLDLTRHSFGFRSIETRDGKILINGQPFYMRAALDQDYYPEGICTPPSLAFLEDQLRKAKALGLNMLRCHIKIPDPRYYEVADRLGMLIWTEIPNVATFTEASAQRLRDTMQGILHRDGNHPCIVIWTLINEDWGTRLTGDPAHRAWLKDTFDWLKALDPTRLVCDNSPCNGNFHVKGDLDDFHYYRSVPERRAEWDALTREFAGTAAWTWTPYGDGVRTGKEPKIVSEFGVWGLPDPAKVTLANAEPWWMETGQGWGDGAAYPHGIQARYQGLGMSTVFGGFEHFITQVQWYQFANLKYQIEAMRSYPQIMGYVITEFTDVHWESNGLLDMNRNPRVFHDRFAEINADVVIVPRAARYSGVAGRDYAFGLAISTGGRALSAAVLKWRADTGEAGEITVAATPALDVVELGNVRFALPKGDGNRMLRIDLTLIETGKTIARNTLDIAVYLPRRASHLPTIGSRDRALADYARDLGYKVTLPEAADITLSRGLDPLDIARLQGGARYLILADGTEKTQGNLRVDERGREQPFLKVVGDTPGIPIGPDGVLPNIALIARHGTMWRGDWIAGFSWIRRDGVFADMPGGPLIDMSFDRVVPHHVMAGFRNWEYGGPVHAAIVVGWVHKPAALIAERRVGRGGLVASTFRLMTEAAGEDPVAGYLFDALTRLASDIRTET